MIPDLIHTWMNLDDRQVRFFVVYLAIILPIGEYGRQAMGLPGMGRLTRMLVWAGTLAGSTIGAALIAVWAVML